MKNAAPPTAATARIPTMMTEAMRTDTQVGSLFVLIPGTYGILSDGVHQPARLLGDAWIIVALTQGHGGCEFFAGGGLFSGFHCQLAELEMRPAVDPLPSFRFQRVSQVRVGLGGAAERCARGAAFVVPQRFLAV